MNTDLVFNKTEKGQVELKSRSHHLNQLPRTVLIMVNGQHTAADMAEQMQAVSNIEEVLEELAMEGFIAANHERWQSLSRSQAVDDIRRQGLNNAESVKQLKSLLTNCCILALGDKATSLIKKIEAAPEQPDDLIQSLKECEKYSALLVEKDQATELKQKFNSLMQQLDIDSRAFDVAVPGTTQEKQVGLKNKLRSLLGG